jgi:hypothetical protein
MPQYRITLSAMFEHVVEAQDALEQRAYRVLGPDVYCVLRRPVSLNHREHPAIYFSHHHAIYTIDGNTPTKLLRLAKVANAAGYREPLGVFGTLGNFIAMLAADRGRV